MNKLQKLIQCIRFRRRVLGEIGKGNRLSRGVSMTSATEVGNYNYFGERVMVGNAIIGNYCSIAPDAKIGQSQHSISYITTYNDISKKNTGYSLNHEKAQIGNDVWIGANAVIMQGVKIGNGAIVGANAVVTHDVPNYAIVVGIPAHIIRYRFNDSITAKIQESEWWNNDFDDACRVVKELEITLSKK